MTTKRKDQDALVARAKQLQRGGMTYVAIAAKLKIGASTLHAWLATDKKAASKASTKPAKKRKKYAHRKKAAKATFPSKEESQISTLKTQVGRLTAENATLQKEIEHWKAIVLEEV